jgi:hypothetical protein
MNLIHTCMALMIAGTLMPVPALAQQPAPPATAHDRAKTPEPVTGEILSLNTATKELVVKTAPDAEMKFSYSEDTEIVGGDQGAEGLAAKTGSIVTVTYDVHGTANIAVKIEIKPKK